MSLSYRDADVTECYCTPREAGALGLEESQPVRRFPAHRRQNRKACGEAGRDYVVATGPEPAVWANLS